MLEVAEKVLNFFKPPDLLLSDLIGDTATMATREACVTNVRKYLVKVSWTLVAGAVIVMIALFTPWGLVRSSDLANKVEAAVKSSELAKSVEAIKTEQQEMKAEVTKINAKLDSINPVLTELYKASTAQTICRMLENKLREAADKEQDKYKTIAGEYYPESRCGGK